VKGPRITLRCDCGEAAKVGYGERFSCPACGRVYDTSQIPEEEYRELEAIRRRYRYAGYAFGAVLAVAVLLLLLQQNPFLLLAGIPALLFIWFTYGRPFLRYRYRRTMEGKVARWKLRAEPGTGPE
jgi:hypothetical protein